jgi:ribosomal protein L20A (L18A)
VVQIFRIKGRFKKGLFVQNFTKELLAISEKSALERVLSEVGSKNGAKRTQIHIEEVTNIKPEEVKDPKVLAMLE